MLNIVIVMRLTGRSKCLRRPDPGRRPKVAELDVDALNNFTFGIIETILL